VEQGMYLATQDRYLCKRTLQLGALAFHQASKFGVAL